MKKVLIGAGVVVVLIVGAVAFLIGNLDDLVKDTVEKVGSEATGAKVSLAGVEISLTDGRGTLAGFRVGNPSGFKADYAFDLGGVSVSLDTATLNRDPVVIKDLVIDGPKLVYELASGGSNIDAIRNNVDAYAAKYAGGGGSDSSGGEGPKLVIDNLYVRGGEVEVSASFLEGKTVGTPLPDIHLRDIGKDEGGVSPAELAERIVSSITARMDTAVSGLDLEGMMQGVSDAAAGAVEGAKGQAESAVEDSTKSVEGAVDGVTEGIGGTIDNLLGN